MIEMNSIKISDLKQTNLTDTGPNELCLALMDIQIAAGQIGKGLTIEQADAYMKECRRVGAVSADDVVRNHEKIAAIVGLTGVKKIYEKYTSGRLTALLQWGIPVELRDEGRHSMLANRWYQDDNGKNYAQVLDPWPATDDKRFDIERAMTQRLVKGAWKDSRSIEYLGWFEKIAEQGH